MNWDDLKVFLAVARTGTLSAAGQGLRMDAATAGRRIARLEAEVGEALYLKSPQGYALTAAGERFLPRAEEAEAALLGAERAVGVGTQDLTGTIRIGAPDGCANFLLPAVAAAIRRDHPGLEFQIVALPRVFNLSKREADLAIQVSEPRSARLLGERIADYRLHLAASEDYLACAPSPLAQVADLSAHRIVGYVHDMIFDTELDYLAEVGLGRPDIASNSVAVQGRCLEAGAGVGIVHDFMLPSLRGVRKVLADHVSLTRTFWLVRHRDDRKREHLNRLSTLIAERMRAEIDRLEAEA